MLSFNISLQNNGCVGYLDQAVLIDNLMTVLTVLTWRIHAVYCYAVNTNYECGNVHVITLWVLGIGYVILLWHSLSLPYNFLTYLKNKGADQHAHPHSLISKFKLVTAYVFC